MNPSSTDHPYRLIREIRTDAGGVLYTAQHTVLERKETLRVLPSPRFDEERFVSRLREVSHAMAMLAHPHVAPVHGFGRLSDGRFFLAMEYLEGDSLSALIGKSGALSQALTRRLLFQLASAIRYVHEQGIVHRHLGPSSVLLVDQDGIAPNLKVRDFGLATILESTTQETGSLSMAGTLYGSPAFLAPESVAGRPGVPSMDVYSFGCIAHIMMTGQPPMAGVRISEIDAPAYDVGLLEVLARCLAPDPLARYSDGAALCEALHALDGFHGEPTWGQGFPASTPTTVGEHAKTIRGGRFPRIKTELDGAGDHTNARDERPHTEHRELDDLIKTTEAMRTGDPQVQARLAELQQVVEALRELERAREQLHSLGESTYRRFVRKESRIRFELGELSFQLGTPCIPEQRDRLDAQLNTLTEELVRAEYLHARELQAITDREVNLASARHELEESKREKWDAFVALVASIEED